METRWHVPMEYMKEQFLDRYPDRFVAVVTGSIKVAIPIGGILIPFLMSIVSQAASLQAALLVFPLSLLLAFVLLWWELRRSPAAAESSCQSTAHSPNSPTAAE